MDRIVSIDLGSTAAKLVCLREDGQLLTALRPEQQAPALALRQFLEEAGLSAGDVSRVVLTGVGASRADPAAFPMPLVVVEEFQASCTGALALSALEEAVVVTMATGTALLHAKADGSLRHLCGSGIGGGTLLGLGCQLTGAADFSRLRALAERGDRNRVDLTLRDVAEELPPTLDPDMTTSNFGRRAPSPAAEDLAAGAFNLVLQAIGTMTVLACQVCGLNTVVLTGSLADLPLARANFDFFTSLYGVRYIIPEHAAFATAIGAGLCALRQPSSQA